jgi:putative FmdB family regulatory protein
MPTYDYKCLKCGRAFEVFQKMSDPVLAKCPECKGKVKRLIGTGSGLIFKGKGFYATDYKKKGASSDTKKEKPKSCGGCDQPTCPNSKKKE